MGEKTLRIGLILLSIALMICPIIAAFASKGWDLQATVMGDLGPLEDLTSREPKVDSGELELLEITDSLFKLGMPVGFDNPYSFSITVENVSIDVFRASDNHWLGQGWLQQETVVPSDSSGSIYIVIEVTNGDLVGALLNLSGTIQLDVYGLTAAVWFEGSVHFPSI